MTTNSSNADGKVADAAEPSQSFLLLRDESSGKTTKWCLTCCNLRFDAPEAVRPPPRAMLRTSELSLFKYLSVGKFQESAAKGCRYCALALEAVRPRWPEAPAETGMNFTVRQNSISVALGLPKEWPGERMYSVELFTTPDIQPAWQGLPVKEAPAPGDADSRFSFLKACLDTCRETHTLCSQKPTVLPTRVLEVGASLDDSRVALVDPDPETRGHYIALSYCWGKSKPLRCLRANEAELKAGFQRSQLPLTLQDAVKLTIQLGIRYIWIDSLCIVQDDAECWEREAAKTGGFYRNAYLTLATASAEACDTGFLHKRDMPEMHRLPMDDEEGNPTVVCTVPVLRGGFHGLRMEPWSTRGWTLQEELLSSRMIVYTNQELQWTCLSESRCECGGVKPEFSRKLTPMWRLSEKQDAFRMWQHYVEEYCDRNLTYANDKLPAVAGLARLVHGVVGCDYKAGLWYDNLVDDLTWCPRDSVNVVPLPQASAPNEYRAPSWSWASVDGPVLNYGRKMADGLVPMASVVDCQVESHPGWDMFGRVRNGWVQVRGAVVETALDVSDPDKPRTRLRDKTVPVMLDAGWDAVPFVDQDRPSNEASQGAATKKRWAACRATFYEGDQEAPNFLAGGEPLTIWLLQFGRFNYEGSKYTNEVYLVLGRAPKDSEGRYQRIGFLKVMHLEDAWPEPYGDDMMRTMTIV